MAITFVGSAENGVAGSTSADMTISLTSLTGGSDSSPSEGDLVLVVAHIGHTADAPTVSLVSTSYTALAQLDADDTYDSALRVFYKFMGATPDTSVVVTRSGNVENAQSGIAHVFRGVDTTNVFDVTTVTATGINIGQPDPAAITPVTDGAWIVVAAGAAHAAITPLTMSALANFQAIGFGDTVDSACCIGTETWNTGEGEYNPAQAGGGTTSNQASWCAYTMALRPAGSAITGTSSKTLATVTETQDGVIAVAGASTKTLATVTETQDGSVALVGASTKTLATVTETQDGSVALVGTSTKTLATVTETQEGTVADPSIIGTSSATLATVTETQDGSVALVGASTKTLATVTETQDGSVAVVGAATATLATVTETQDGTIGAVVTGASDATLGTVTASQDAAVTGLATPPVVDEPDTDAGSGAARARARNKFRIPEQVEEWSLDKVLGAPVVPPPVQQDLTNKVVYTPLPLTNAFNYAKIQTPSAPPALKPISVLPPDDDDDDDFIAFIAATML